LQCGVSFLNGRCLDCDKPPTIVAAETQPCDPEPATAPQCEECASTEPPTPAELEPAAGHQNEECAAEVPHEPITNPAPANDEQTQDCSTASAKDFWDNWAPDVEYENEEVLEAPGRDDGGVCHVPTGVADEQYEDLSDLSSLDGNENLPHRKLKEHAAAKRAAKLANDTEQTLIEPNGVLADHAASPEMYLAPTLVPCGKNEAGLATEITQQLQQMVGREAAKALLSQYTQAVLRDCGKKRYWIDAAGATMKLMQQKNVAP
jgi:cytochrome c2